MHPRWQNHVPEPKALLEALLEATKGAENPLYEIWVRLMTQMMDIYSSPLLRESLVHMFSWAIPDSKALSLIAEVGPLIEIGAGKGYWAHLLSKQGVDIKAFDSHVPYAFAHSWHENLGDVLKSLQAYFPLENWFPVQEGNSNAIKENPDRTLFLCWPPYDDSMAANCLDAYKGKTLIMVGEGEGGCTGDDEFWLKITEGWQRTLRYSIPTWPGIHDQLSIYSR